MSKSILVIDTPSSCRKCPIHEYNSLSNTHYCNAVYDEDCFHKAARKINKNNEYGELPIPSWCPLSHFPSHKDLTKYIMRGDTRSMTHLVQYIHDQGYNDCLDDIVKKGDKE